jgi:hypothetical protein
MKASYAVSPAVKAFDLLVTQPSDSGLGVCTQFVGPIGRGPIPTMFSRPCGLWLRLMRNDKGHVWPMAYLPSVRVSRARCL